MSRLSNSHCHCRDRVLVVLRRGPLDGGAIVNACSAWSTSTVRAALRSLLREGRVVHDRQGGLWALYPDLED